MYSRGAPPEILILKWQIKYQCQTKKGKRKQIDN